MTEEVNPTEVDKINLEIIQKTQDSALAIITKHLILPMKEMRSAKYNNADIAYALILLGYQVLRESRQKEKAIETFGLLFHHAQRTGEKIRKKLY